MKEINKAILIIISLILITPCFTGLKVNATQNKVTAQEHNPILFLHGWTKSMMDWVSMKEWFKADGWPDSALYAYNFDDRSECSVQANINNANKIKQWVKEILNETGAEKIDLVGHSMGGTSSMYYIKFLGGIDRVDDYVSLGCPHHGTSCCTSCCFSFNKLDTFVIMLNEGDETPGGLLNDTLGDRFDPYGGISYNGTHTAGNINYTSIYSRDDGLIIPYNTSRLDGAYNIEVEKLGHSQLYQDESVYKLVKAAVDDPHQLSPPSLIFPIGGETLSEDVNISWTASVDTWDYSVTYKVSYSTDGGTTWTLIKADLTDPSFIWNTSTVPDGSNYILKIEAISSDGLKAAFISVSPFTVANPTTTITTTESTQSTPGFILMAILLSIATIVIRKRLSKVS